MVVVKVGGQRGRVLAQIEERNQKQRKKQEMQYTKEIYKKFDSVSFQSLRLSSPLVCTQCTASPGAASARPRLTFAAAPGCDALPPGRDALTAGCPWGGRWMSLGPDFPTFEPRGT